MKRMEESYWWHVGRRHLIRRTLEHYLGPRGSIDILDVGCGSGRNLELLRQFGTVRGVEPEGPGLESCRADGLGPDVVSPGMADSLPFDDTSFDLVTAFDVLEHLEDDVLGLQEMRRVLRPGGYALITVPAYRFLWSVHDEVLGHRRRYVASEIHNLFNNNGFVVVRRTYAISFALPAILAYRIGQGLFPPAEERSATYVDVGRVPNWLLTQALKFESRVLGHVDLPAGASVLALARRV